MMIRKLFTLDLEAWAELDESYSAAADAAN